MEEAVDDWVAEAYLSDVMVAEILMSLSRPKQVLRFSMASKSEAEIDVKWSVRKNRRGRSGSRSEYWLERAEEASAGCGVVGGGDTPSPATPLDWKSTPSHSQEEGNDSSSQLKRKRTPAAATFPVDSQSEGVVNVGGDCPISTNRVSISPRNMMRGVGDGAPSPIKKKKKSCDEWKMELNQQMMEQEQLKKEKKEVLMMLDEARERNARLKEKERKQNTNLKEVFDPKISPVRTFLPISHAVDIPQLRCFLPETSSSLPVLRHLLEKANGKRPLVVESSVDDQPSTSDQPDRFYLGSSYSGQLVQQSSDADLPPPPPLQSLSSAPVKERKFLLPDLNITWDLNCEWDANGT